MAKKNSIDAQIAEKRKEIENIQKEITQLLAKKLKANLGDVNVGDTVYYPVPPQKKVVPCKLELEETKDGDVMLFVRSFKVDDKTGEEILSKRHYCIGANVEECEELSLEPPEEEEEIEEAVVVKPKKTTKNSKKDSSDGEEVKPKKKIKLGKKK